MVVMKNETELEIESLKAEIQRLKNNQRYGLIWEDSPEKLDDPSIVPLLREMKDKRIEMIEDGEQNYLIEGDNYHALKALQHTHKGKVDVIYIDPPYNTGNEFVYNDKIVDKEDGYRHSKWLSFMAKRLKLAQRLLSDDGVIFVSIDDNEQAQLKLLMDSIFGEKNFVTTLPRMTTSHRSGQENHLNVSHDYILIYSFKQKFSNVIDRETDGKKMKVDNIGKYIVGDTATILASESQGYSEGGDYDVHYNGKTFKPIDSRGKRHRWLWSKERMEVAKDLGILVETGSGGLRVQLYLNKKFEVGTNKMVGKDDLLKLHSKDLYESIYTNNRGSKEIEDFGMKNEFSYPKPTQLLMLLLKLSGNKNATVLDFFAGSGTTGHAVLELNKEDGGNRKFILCTNNEVSEEKVRQHFMEQGLLDKNNKTAFNKFKKENEQLVQEFMDSEAYQELGIARSVTYERNRKVIQGYTTPKGVEVEGIAANLRYLKTVEYDRMGIMFPFIRDQVFEDVKNLHELAFPSTEYDNYYIQVDDEINLLYKGKPMTVLLGGNEKENELIINHIAHLGFKNTIYRTIESYT